MEVYHLLSAIIVLSAGFAYINHRLIRLPNAIGLMLISLVFSFLVILGGILFPSAFHGIQTWITGFDFSMLLLDSMLGFMLFAGAIHVRLEDLKEERFSIIVFSTLSVIISTFIIGIVIFYLGSLFGISLPLIHCLLFGSLISPTDPIAVLSILKKAGVSKSLETKIAGESLFNDGIAVVVFVSLWKIAGNPDGVFMSDIVLIFVQETIGGILLGLIIGYSGFKLISSIDNYQVEIMITLALVMGGYLVAHHLHVSGPLAMVVTGLITGNHGKKLGMSDITADYIDKFWEVIDEILNTVLFVLIGIELLILKVNTTIFILGIIMIFVSLTARVISIWLPAQLIRFKEKINSKTIFILTWGGLRGGISIALALSLKPEYGRDIFVTLTYIIVCFSIIFQGLTIGKLASNKSDS